MKYFAYGSNMSFSRIRSRVSSAEIIGTCFLHRYSLRFHKASKDGSGKCDAFFTGDDQDIVWGVLYDIDSNEKYNLDLAEGLGYGYNEKEVEVTSLEGGTEKAIMYYAEDIDASLPPYTWYMKHVLVGAREANLPADYIKKIESIDARKDYDKEREEKELEIYKIRRF